jgi:DNA-binding transcriptional ArsR family regulator
MTGSPAEVKLVSNAMANATRRKIMAMLAEKERTKEEIEQAVGGSMLDYHLQMLGQAGLAEMREGRVGLTDFGKNFMEPTFRTFSSSRNNFRIRAPTTLEL